MMEPFAVLAKQNYWGQAPIIGPIYSDKQEMQRKG
jgi:hypothetical protein